VAPTSSASNSNPNSTSGADNSLTNPNSLFPRDPVVIPVSTIRPFNTTEVNRVLSVINATGEAFCIHPPRLFHSFALDNGTAIILYPANLLKFLNANFNVSFQCTVVSDIASPYGRYPNVLGNMVIIDKSFAQSLLSTDVSQFVANPLLNVLFKAVLLGQTRDFQFINLTVITG
jgi:hypothetical protein